MKKLATKNSQPFHPIRPYPSMAKMKTKIEFEYFEDSLQTTFRMQPKLTKAMTINHFHAHLRGFALKLFKITQRTQQRL